jgi:hypothetical protein
MQGRKLVCHLIATQRLLAEYLTIADLTDSILSIYRAIIPRRTAGQPEVLSTAYSAVNLDLTTYVRPIKL